MLTLRDLLDREVERHDHEWMETMQRLTITEKTVKRSVSIRSRTLKWIESVSEFDSERCPSQDLVCGVSTIDRYSDCPGRQCRNNQGTEICPGSRPQSDQGTKFCPGSRPQSDEGTEICPGVEKHHEQIRR